ncbi:hypothetical protein F4804DRAFT_330063 [Jackrogersella minutella]|nr:hypothetical protein F4804DRAFT_330063 [Jackrogersella minutella]
MDNTRVLSRGIMVGAAFILSAFAQYEDAFYQNLIFFIFAISTSTHIILNWEAFKRYFFLALITVFVPTLVTLPYPQGSMSSLLHRLPILIMTMNLLIEEYYRRFTDNRHWERDRIPDPGLVPPDAESEVEEYPIIPMSGQSDELLVYMNGGEREQYQAPSQVSSDISL